MMNRGSLCLSLLCVALAAAASPARGQPSTDNKKDESTPQQRLAIADQATAGLVTVEYTVQYDKGESPGGRHGDAETMIREERPMEIEGWLISPTEVITRDTDIHARFIKGLAVRLGEDVVGAKVAGYYKTNAAVLLKLDRPLEAGKPLAFKPDAKGLYYYVDRVQNDAHWTTTVLPVEMNSVCRTDADRKFIPSAAVYSLVVDKAGDPVGLQMHFQYPLDDSWKGSPANWPMFTQDEMDKLIDDVSAKADQGLLRLKIHFRSPKKDVAGRYGGEGGPTEQTCQGLLIEPTKLLVLAYLDPKLTARLERVEAFPSTAPDAAPVKAVFAGTLTDYGCFLATLDKPLPGAMALVLREPIEKVRGSLLLAIDLRLQGDQRVVYYLRDRISRFDLGWKRRIYPEEYAVHFLVEPATGEIVVVPVAHREKVAVRESYGGGGRSMMPAGYVAEALADVPKSLDPNNVPLTEEQENRLAWLGVELQPMDAELARANKISDLTQDGANGAVVSWVYPDSPAGKAGVQPGWIVIRLHAADQPKPIDVRLEYSGQYWENYPWDKWDQLPEAYFDQVPKPWPPLENSFSRSLTDLGFGKSFTAEFWVPATEGGAGGKLVAKEFVIEQSPPHFDTAAKYKNDDIGLTVRDMTYEVRRYFRKTADDPGVIISKVEPGSKASVAGIKPFELVTKVNDQPIKTVAEFEKLVTATKGELRLYIARMARGRVAKIDMAAPKPTTRPAHPVIMGGDDEGP